MASIRNRVNLVLSAWCGADPNTIDQSMSLSDLWASTGDNPDSPHSAIPFLPEGVEDMLRKLAKEFRRPGTVRKDTSQLTTGSLKPNGDIETVDDLVRAVVHCPNLPPMQAGGIA